MKRRAFVLVVGLAALTLPGSAFACREYTGPERIEGTFDAVVIATVTSSEFAGDQSRFYHWHAKAKLERIVQGATDQSVFEFGGAWESAGCTRTRPPPPAGDRFVLYLKRDHDRLQVDEAVPFEIAQKIDPRFSAQR